MRARLWLVFLGCTLSLPELTCAQSLQKRLFQEHGIEALESAHSEQWHDEELQLLVQLMSNTPQPLSLLFAPTNHSPSLVLYKNYNQLLDRHQDNCNTHQLNIIINVEQSPSSPGRQLLHYLLHCFDANTKLSDSAQWRQLSGWNTHLLGIYTNANNQDNRAYASAAGKNNPREDFVTLAESFILPPISTIETSIKCRTPRKYAFVKHLFKDFRSPLDNQQIQCRSIRHGLLDDIVLRNPADGKEIDLGPINNDTVKGFEILYATPGTGDAAEIAGHVLLRIKLANNPEAEELGIENPNDLVISFLANTEEQAPMPDNPPSPVRQSCQKNWWELNETGAQNFNALRSITQALKGLSGGFLTLMNRQTLAQTIRLYTVEEDRDLLRYQLHLDANQKNALLEHLYRAKKNYNARYYFFNQNCASVLVKIIGQGIGNEVIANFNPLVSPPNSLVALLIREGVASPVYPTLHSYRKKGYLAQEKIKHQYAMLVRNNSDLPWPAIDPLFHRNEAHRLKIVTALQSLATQAPLLHQQIYQLAILIQEAELVYTHKDILCEEYTSAVTTQSRLLQRQLLSVLSFSVAQQAFDTNNILATSFIEMEDKGFQQGVPHTKLFAYALGFGQYQSKNTVLPIVRLSAALDAQEMGSISNIAMQRGSYVALGSANVSFGNNTLTSRAIQTWQVTALHIRKFKQRLNQVPAYFSPAGSVGLGLTLLDFNGNNSQNKSRGILLGGELLFNLFSSTENNRFAFISLGADIQRNVLLSQVHLGIALPVYAETLFSFDKQRKWQWRNKMAYRVAADSDFADEYQLATEINYRLGSARKPLLLFKLSGEYAKSYQATQDLEPLASLVTWLGVEFNPW